MSRRLINEQRINKWPPNWHFYKEDNTILVFIDTIYKNKTLILNIDTSNSYPFCPPKVTCDVTDCERDVPDSMSDYAHIARGIGCIRW